MRAPSPHHKTHKNRFVTRVNSHDGGRMKTFANLKIFCSRLLKYFHESKLISSRLLTEEFFFHGADGIRSAVSVWEHLQSPIWSLSRNLLSSDYYELRPCCSFLNRILPWTFAIFLDQSFLGPYQLLYSFLNLLGLDCDFNADTWSFRLDLRESSSSFYK